MYTWPDIGRFGLIVGVVLKSKMPTGILNTLSFAIFAVFGEISIRDAMLLIFGAGAKAVAGHLIITVVFAVLCLYAFVKRRAGKH